MVTFLIATVGEIESQFKSLCSNENNCIKKYKVKAQNICYNFFVRPNDLRILKASLIRLIKKKKFLKNKIF